jgi:hypothetical protein
VLPVACWREETAGEVLRGARGRSFGGVNLGCWKGNELGGKDRRMRHVRSVGSDEQEVGSAWLFSRMEGMLNGR